MAASTVGKGLLWGTIGANVYIWGRWHVLPDANAAKQGRDSHAYQLAQTKHIRYMNDNYTLSRKNMAEGRWWTLITSAFSHYDMAHLGINMLVLHSTASLGLSTAIGLGPIRLAVLGLGSAVCGSLGSLYDCKKTAEAGLPESRGLGASGMVEGVMMATVLAQPRWPMMVFPIPVSVPYWAVMAGFVGYDMYRLYREKMSGQKHVNWMGSYTGYAAHLGGAVFGAAFYFLGLRRGMLMRRAAWAQKFRQMR
ncbi:hypothetical protein DHEL01_v202018 [Diaporthe helianthi]|uniref:Peptidase S54 rhomboid domain-containing protein n=1 Tax=Diaporthe helianthi TaxID=158607 RepID=A0A2P5IAR9_DIAHE|nr:hypothetical protein DHEL01_v202018 [Diaporthe helianthi]